MYKNVTKVSRQIFILIKLEEKNGRTSFLMRVVTTIHLYNFLSMFWYYFMSEGATPGLYGGVAKDPI